MMSSSMRITLLGHASLLVQTSDLTILTDPTLHEPFFDTMAEICPSRRIDVEALPDIDVLYVSHRHHDHFEVGSLAALVERVNTVLCPDDDLIVRTLETLGYDAIQPVEDRMEIELGNTQLLITPSQVPVPEHGLVISDESGRIWNQVDTLVDPDWLGELGLVGSLDVHFANFQPITQNEVLTNSSTRFPARLYDDAFETVRRVGAKLVVPSSVGFAFTGSHAWLNHYWFPVGHEEFARDLRSLGRDCQLMRPGDVLELRGGETAFLEQAVPELVSTVDPSLERLRFRPSVGIPPLLDDNPYDIERSALEEGVEAVIAKANEGLTDPAFASQLELLARWSVVLGVRVKFPDGRDRTYEVAFADDNPKIRPCGETRANYVFETIASGLHGVHTGLMWERYFIAGYRAYDKLYRVTDVGIVAREEYGQGRLRTNSLPGPADLFLRLWSADQQRWLDRQMPD